MFKRKSKQPELRACPRCDAMIAREELDCPACGLDLREAYHPTASALAAQQNDQGE
jgi:hypothetical protein